MMTWQTFKTFFVSFLNLFRPGDISGAYDRDFHRHNYNGEAIFNTKRLTLVPKR